MSEKVLALTADGKMTWCVAPPEKRGKGKCNHVAHQQKGQSVQEFIEACEDRMQVQDDSIADQTQHIQTLVSEYGMAENPDWAYVIKDRIKNHFTIGSGENYEEADLKSVAQEEMVNEEGDAVIQLTGTWEFRGETYTCDLGQIPKVQEDGTFSIHGVDWRYVPVMEQNKAGVVSYYENVVVLQDDGNVAFSIPKDRPDVMKIRGAEIPVEVAEAYWRGEEVELTLGQQWALDHLDPAVEQRFQDIKQNVAQLADLPKDEPNDVEWRRVRTYQDAVEHMLDAQMRRMGVTFRTNLAKNQKLEEQGEEPKWPLFYQQNITSNVQELTGYSNVQFADNTNAIAALSQSQKISFTGPGGFNKDKAPAALRDVHSSHEGILETLDTSGGKNVGLTVSLSGGYIGQDGFIHKKPADQQVGLGDFIPYKEHNDPNRAIMACAQMKQALPITGGEDPLVSTPAWDKIKGSKIGTNLATVYVPMAGVYEDAVVISESAAAKMMTEKRKTYKVRDVGDLRVGQQLQRGDRIGNSGQRAVLWGEVESIQGDHVVIKTRLPMGPGDKIANRHGGKSVVSRVLPDDQMPTIIQDGREVHSEIVMSPLSVAGRSNLGQVYECNGGVFQKETHSRLPGGKVVKATGGPSFIMRLDQNAEEKLASHANERDSKNNFEGVRMGMMESVLLTSTEDRRKILTFLRHQEQDDSHHKLDESLKSIGVRMKVNGKDYF